uniref:THAP4-like heme-binding domain-containing protein n=1 Tax=Accipiter nisus TaxID=211598 RepID=A0A8B9N281_9AVES
FEPLSLNPVMEPLSWMLGTWLSDLPGDLTFPTTKPFEYLEEVHISQVGQPIIFCNLIPCIQPETSKAMHQKCRFIHLKPDTSKVATTSTQGLSLGCLPVLPASDSIFSFSSEQLPHVHRLTPCSETSAHLRDMIRKYRLHSGGKWEQTIPVAATAQPDSHLHIGSKKVTL